MTMKDLARKVALGSGVLQLAARLRSPSVAILMYHSVMEQPQEHEAFLGGIVHSRSVFRGHMELLARKYYLVSLDQILRLVRGETELPRRAVAVTFDDGYTDNYEIATPILQQTGVPATFYATVGCIERRTLPWPSHLRFFFRKANRPRWTDSSGKIWPLSNHEDRENAFLRSCDEYCHLPGSMHESYIAALSAALEVQMPAGSGRLMMNYDQMGTLVQQGHIIGSHTMTHPNMAYLNAEDARREFFESKSLLEKALRAPVVHFSYPCPALTPHWSEQTLDASRQAGYETAVTTDPGLVRKGDDLLKLKRVRPSKTVEGLRWNLESAFAGREV